MAQHTDPAVEQHRDRRNVGERRRAHDGGAKAERRGQVEEVVDGAERMHVLAPEEHMARPFENRINCSHESKHRVIDQGVGVRPTDRSDAEEGDRKR